VPKDLTVALGANVCSKDGSFNQRAVISISSQFLKLSRNGCRVIGVVGAGGIAREYLDVAMRYEKRHKALDDIAIRVSRANALLLISRLRAIGAKVLPKPLTALKQLDEPWFNRFDSSGTIVVFGGLKPGLTSDSTAALISKRLGSPLIIVSTVGGIFETDPNKIKRGKPPRMRSSVDLQYVREIIAAFSTSGERQTHGAQAHVLDRQTCRILQEESSKGKVAQVYATGYKHIIDCARDSVPGRRRKGEGRLAGRVKDELASDEDRSTPIFTRIVLR